MKAKKVLFITSEMAPFVTGSQLSKVGREMPQAIQELGHEIRSFSPKWGGVNERRNQLHEVIRLSGMNLIINDTDHPLIIKVASISAARMQIYFIDNDEFFSHRTGIITDENGRDYPDNAERAIFYARGVLETVKKLRWVPDIIHCHGWMAAVAPLFIKRAYMDEPSFCSAKVVFSASAEHFEAPLSEKFRDCIAFRGITPDEVADIQSGIFSYADYLKIGAKYSDGVIIDPVPAFAEVKAYAESIGRPVLVNPEGNDYASAYSQFYESIMD